MNDDLWMVAAVIQPFKLDAVSYALQQVPGFGGMTVSDCRGYGQGKLKAAPDAALSDFTGKLKVEAAVAGRATAERVANALARAAHTGRPGDGKVFVWPLSRVVGVRTLAENANAL